MSLNALPLSDCSKAKCVLVRVQSGKPVDLGVPTLFTRALGEQKEEGGGKTALRDQECLTHQALAAGCALGAVAASGLGVLTRSFSTGRGLS
jgi:hypothetical protein